MTAADEGSDRLADFLVARIEEVEALARAAQALAADGHPRIDASASQRGARILRECEVNRQRLTRHLGAHACGGELWDDYYGACADLRLWASVYADHPDFRDEWRP